MAAAKEKLDIGRYDFLGKAKFLIPATVMVTVVALAQIMLHGFYYGIDFAGGTEVQIQFSQNVERDTMAGIIEKAGFDNFSIQKFGDSNEFLIRMEALKGKSDKEINDRTNEMVKKITTALTAELTNAGANIRRVDSVGPQVGDQLKRDGLLATFYSLIIMLIYIGLRFDYKYAPGAVFCLFHDTIWVLGIFSFFHREVNVQTMAAVLTLIGYSINDTIINFDRIRENEKLYPGYPLYDVVNKSINDMLSRTVYTSLTTLMACTALYYFADGTIKDIAFTMGIGIVLGTFSSIYIASPLVILYDRWEKRRAERLRTARA